MNTNTQTLLETLRAQGWTVRTHWHDGERTNAGQSSMKGRVADSESQRVMRAEDYSTRAKGVVGGNDHAEDQDSAGQFNGLPTTFESDPAIGSFEVVRNLFRTNELSAYRKIGPNRFEIHMNFPGLRTVARCGCTVCRRK